MDLFIPFVYILCSAVALGVVLAIQTHYVHKNNFKDTKKVNFFFIFLVTVVVIEAGIDISADVSKWLAYLLLL